MPPPSSLPWTGPRTPPRGSEPPGGCRLTTGAEPGIALLDEPGSALFACRPKGRFRQTVRPGATRETAGRMKRLPRPGLASLEWSSLAADTGTFRRQTGGAFRPGRLFLCRLIDNVDPYERAGAAIAGISLRTAASRRAHSRLIQDGILNQTPKTEEDRVLRPVSAEAFARPRIGTCPTQNGGRSPTTGNGRAPDTVPRSTEACPSK